ncbi:MAG TPA: hypothetical protein VI146_00645 [Nitrososphaeraceae archaeon]
MDLFDSDESIKPKKTKSITFRLDTKVIEELQREADQGEISLNVLVNQVLRRFVEWDRYENKLGMIPIPKSMLSTLIDKTMQLATDAKIADLDSYRTKIVNNAAETALNVMKDSVLFMRKDYSFWTVLDVLREYMKVAGITSDHRIEEGRKHVFIIQHELGENWSLFAKELLLKIFAELAKVKADISTTSKTVKAEVNL